MQLLGGIFLYPQWSFTPHLSSFEINFWIFKSDLVSGTGTPGRLTTLEKLGNLQTKDLLIMNDLGLFTKNLLDCNDWIIRWWKLTFQFSKFFPCLKMIWFQMTRNQQNWFPEGPVMCSGVISSLKFDNKSFLNYSNISVPEIYKIVVLLSLKCSNGLKKMCYTSFRG